MKNDQENIDNYLLSDGVRIGVGAVKHGGIKCPRCWHYHYLRDTHDELCDRCQMVMAEAYPDHPSTEKIKAAMKAERKKYCVRSESEACPHLRCCRMDE